MNAKVPLPTGTMLGKSFEYGCDINVGTFTTPIWQPFRRISGFQPTPTPQTQDAQTYDDLGAPNNDVTGWGISTGGEYKTKLGNFGLSLAYLAGNDADGGTDNEVTTGQYELAAYWRGNWGGFHADARASGARINFESDRRFIGTAAGAAVERNAEAKWDGTLFSASAGMSYQIGFGRFSLRPTAAIDYYRLKEDGYAETGGGDAFNLTVDGRTSDELAATGTVVAGFDFGGKDRDAGWMRAEIEGGRRQIIGGSMGATTAHFKDGADFTLLPEERTDGWVGKLRLVGGTSDFSVGGEFSAEEQQNRAAVAFRVSLHMGL